jgi:hypothetical protein
MPALNEAFSGWSAVMGPKLRWEPMSAHDRRGACPWWHHPGRMIGGAAEPRVGKESP